MKAEEMRLIFKGKILKDELTLEDFKITDGLTIHLVKGKTAAAASDSTGAGGASLPASGTGPAGGSPAGGMPGMAAGGAGANPFAGMQGMGGMGGMGGGMGGGMPNMNADQMNQMMNNPMVQQILQDPATM